MGTRNLTVVVVDGQYKVAQYGQWDGNPTGNGKKIVDFLKSVDLSSFKNKVRKCSWITEEELEQQWVECGANSDEDFIDWEVNKEHAKKYPQVNRDTGANILKVINSSDGLKLQSNLEFAAESLFCEWVYILDLDNEQLEIYKGFNTKSVHKSERFSDLIPKDIEFNQVTEVLVVPFSGLDDDIMEDLEEYLNNEQGE